MLLRHDKRWLLIWRSISIISTESKIGGQQSPVHCLDSKCRRNFPQNSEQLGFALLRAFCFCGFCSSLWIFRSKFYSMVGFKARLGHPKWCFKTLTQNWIAPLQGWSGSQAARGPFRQFLGIARLSIWLSINSSGKIKKHVKNCFQRTVSAFQSLCRDRFG